MKVLITGAAGRVGSRLVRSAMDVGHEVVATDVAYNRESPVRLNMIDLTQPLPVYQLLEGCDAVIHAGNHPFPGARRPDQVLLSENIAMNANVFRAATDVGVRRIVFISSIQAVLGRSVNKMGGYDHIAPPPYLPLDGELPPNPGHNYYGLSKAFGERLLEAICRDTNTEVAGVSIRLPMVVLPEWREYYESRMRRKGLPQRAEVFSHIDVGDAASAAIAAIEKPLSGYQCYFPAYSFDIEGMSPTEIAQQYYPDVPVRRPLDEAGLIDTRREREELGWKPTAEPLKVARDTAAA